jgi:hypothetical protein
MPEKLAQRPGVGDGEGAYADRWRELAVANPTFLPERFGSECSDLQGLRELAVNGLDAIAALGADHPGRVVWDLGWGRHDTSGGGERHESDRRRRQSGAAAGRREKAIARLPGGLHAPS